VYSEEVSLENAIYNYNISIIWYLIF